MADEVIGERRRDLGDFDTHATTTEGYLHNKDLNPQPLSWKQKLARVAAAGIATTGLIIGGKATFDKLSAPPEYFGEPFGDGVPLITDLVLAEDNMEKLVEPTYRSKPSIGGDELTQEELQERGFHPNLKDGVIIQEVKGGTYPFNPLHGKGRIEEDGETFGVWGEILMPQVGGDIGEYKRTGIFVSENFINQEKGIKIELDEGKQPQIFDREEE